MIYKLLKINGRAQTYTKPSPFISNADISPILWGKTFSHKKSSECILYAECDILGAPKT